MRKMKINSRLIAAIAVLLMLCSGVVPLSLARAETASTSAGQAETVTQDCTITVPEERSGTEYRLTDALVESYQSFKSGQSIQVGLPQNAQGLYLEWFSPSLRYTVIQYDQSGAALSEAGASPYLNAYYPLQAGAVRVSVSFTGNASLSTLAVYGAGELPGHVQRWNQPAQADLLVIASTSKTALDEFFGVIATYACNHDIPTALVVMSPNTRSAQQELLSALWHAGYDQYPYFGEFTSVNDKLYGMVKNEWGRKPTLTFITNCIAQYQPKVIVTHIDDESAPEGTAQFTGEYTLRAAKDADIRKLYFASESGGTRLSYDTALNGCSGKTVLALAAEAFALCPTRHVYETALIPSSAFLLAESTVGKDASGDNLFENIDTATLRAYVDPTPTPAPTPEPTEVPVAEPTQEPALEAAASPAETDGTQDSTGAQSAPLEMEQLASLVLRIGIAAAGGLLSLLLLFTYGLKKRRRRVRGSAVALSLFPLLLGLLATGALIYFDKQKDAEEALAPTPAPTATATIEPTPTPEITPEPEPEPEEKAASADDAFYRQPGDPEEVIFVDEENGRWEYRTDTLSIEIDRVITDYVNRSGRTFPLVYFVAHIRMREIDQFRTVQAADNRNGAGAIKPWVLARRNKAVLMITGDNLTESDTQYKSILIRDGKVFLDSAKSDIMAMYPDMTMRIFSPKQVNASDLLMDGVREAFSFGPTMIRDGQLTSVNIDQTARIGNETNPRTGIGMIEPGHFVAIVVDGRQKDYSYGMRLSAFAELFVKEGCVEAYNLDGGVSACMLFMGEQLNRHGNKRVGTIEDTYQRRIPDGLVWGYSDTVPSEQDPIYHRGEG